MLPHEWSSKTSCDNRNVWFILGGKFKTHWYNENADVTVSVS